MESVSALNKLELLSQIRERYQEDQNDLFKREEILYGISHDQKYEKKCENAKYNLKCRVILSIFLFLCYVLLNQYPIAEKVGITSERILEIISTDYASLLENLVLPIS